MDTSVVDRPPTHSARPPRPLSEIEAGEEISLLDGVNWITRQWPWVVATALLVGLWTGYKQFQKPVHWSASGTYMPISPEGAAGPSNFISGLLAGLTGENFYQELFKSRSLVTDIARQHYEFVDKDGKRKQGTLFEIYELGDPNDPRAQREAVKKVEGMIGLSFRPTGVMDITATAESPRLAEQLVTHAVAGLDAWNQRNRRSRATIERDWLAERAEAAGQELRASEARLQAWLEQNRTFSSPGKTFEQARLEREADQKRSTYTSLVGAHEQARIAAVRETPFFVVLDPPLANDKPSSRQIWLHVPRGILMGAVLGFFLAFAWAFVARGGWRIARDLLKKLSLPTKYLRRT